MSLKPNCHKSILAVTSIIAYVRSTVLGNDPLSTALVAGFSGRPYMKVAIMTRIEPKKKKTVSAKSPISTYDSKPVRIIEMLLAKPLRMLSAYLGEREKGKR